MFPALAVPQWGTVAAAAEAGSNIDDSRQSANTAVGVSASTAAAYPNYNPYNSYNGYPGTWGYQGLPWWGYYG